MALSFRFCVGNILILVAWMIEERGFRPGVQVTWSHVDVEMINTPRL